MASWINLGDWVDSGLLSFDGELSGPIAWPRGTWMAEIEDLSIGGMELGTASTGIELEDGTFASRDFHY